MKKKIIIRGTFKGTCGKGRPKVKRSDSLKEITGHTLLILYHIGSERCRWNGLTKGKENATSCILLNLYIDRINPKYFGRDRGREGDNLVKIITQWYAIGPENKDSRS